VSLLYLANDIMQNSRKEGNGFIAEFMRIIPAALNEVFTNGDDFGRNVVKRLVREHPIDIYVQGLMT
jgi:regulator of Ty1 transposition protein 103